MTSYNISRVPLTPGILFYSNVVGYSLSGIHSTETSDGIMVDSFPPTSGTLFDVIGILQPSIDFNIDGSNRKNDTCTMQLGLFANY